MPAASRAWAVAPGNALRAALLPLVVLTLATALAVPAAAASAGPGVQAGALSPPAAQPGQNVTLLARVTRTSGGRLLVVLSADTRAGRGDTVVLRKAAPRVRGGRAVRLPLRFRVPRSAVAGRRLTVFVCRRSVAPARCSRASKRLTVQVGDTPGLNASGLGAAGPAALGAPPAPVAPTTEPSDTTPTTPPAPEPPTPPALGKVTETSSRLTAPNLSPAAGPIPGFADQIAFLHTGASPPQQGVAAGTITRRRAAVMRGRVLDRAGAGVPGLDVRVRAHTEFGRSTTRADGGYDMAVNGGGMLTISITGAGIVPLQRTINVPAGGLHTVPDLVVTPLDVRSTAFQSGAASAQSHVSSVTTDERGSRRASVFVPAGVVASMTLPGGTTAPLPTFTVRLTEVTYGPGGPQAMPGELPIQTAYTLAIERSVDEAIAAGATGVRFSAPVIGHLDNNLGFPVGTLIPQASYDRGSGTWNGEQAVRVIGIVAEVSGEARLDLDGDGVAESTAALEALGIGVAERGFLAERYTPGDSTQRAVFTHFSTSDINLPWAPYDVFEGEPPATPTIPDPDQRESPDDPANPRNGGDDCESGSIIVCRSRELRESVPVPGAGFSLAYSSDRADQARTTIDLPVVGSEAPANVTGIEVSLLLAGRAFHQNVAPAPNTRAVFTWDGLDALGRRPPSEQEAVLGVCYNRRIQATRSWGSGGTISTPPVAGPWAGFAVRAQPNTALGTTTLQRCSQRMIRVRPPRRSPVSPAHLGRWSVDVNHVYDAQRRLVYRGDGSILGRALALETSALVLRRGSELRGKVAVDAAGRTYVTELVNAGGSVGEQRVRRLNGDGTSTIVAGASSNILALAFDRDGRLLIATETDGVRRVDLDTGQIDTVIDGSGDLRPAAIEPGADGALWVFDYTNIRRVDPSGEVTIVAGPGAVGGAIGALDIRNLRDIGLDGQGNLLLAFDDVSEGSFPPGTGRTEATLVRVTAAGALEPVSSAPYLRSVAWDAARARILVMTDPGTLTISAVQADGGLRPLVGQGDTTGPEGGPAQAIPTLGRPLSFAVGLDGRLSIGEYGARVLRVDPALPGPAATDADVVDVPSPSGTEVWRFDAGGRHLRTIDALTGAVLWRFTYAADGSLTEVLDRDDRSITVAPTRITPPGVPATTLDYTAPAAPARPEVSVIDTPGPGTTRDRYRIASDALGLIRGFTDPRGRASTMSYDADGRLTADEAPGRTVTLTPTADGVSVTVNGTETTTYATATATDGTVTSRVTRPGGLETTSVAREDGTHETTFADGTIERYRVAPDPRFGMAAPYVDRLETVRPSGETSLRTVTRTATLDGTSRIAPVELRDVATTDGETETTEYTGATRQLRHTSAAGRVTGIDLDARGRTLRTHAAVGDIDPLHLSYDAAGRVVRAGFDDPAEPGIPAQAIVSTYAGAARDPATQTDALGQTLTFDRDQVGFARSVTQPGGAKASFSLLAGGDLGAVETPRGGKTAFTRDDRGQVTAFTAPGQPARTFALDAQGRLSTTTVPGRGTRAIERDDQRRPVAVRDDRGATRVEYGDASLRASAIEREPSAAGATTERAELTYDGTLQTGVSMSGSLDGFVRWTANAQRHLLGTTISIGGVSEELPRTLDADGAPTAIDGFALRRQGPGRRIDRVTAGAVTLEVRRDRLGRTSGRTLRTSSGTVRFDADVRRDGVGRVREVRESIDGDPVATTTYEHDARGRLTSVQQGTTTVETDGYDADGNRTSRKLGALPAAPSTFDLGGRLVTREGESVTHDGAGFRTADGRLALDYALDGALLSATAGGSTVAYAVDGLGRRVARTVGGATDTYVYGNPANDAQVTAVRRDGVTTLLTYDDEGLLVGLRRGADRYVVATDQVGTPRVIVDAATGAVVKQLTFDAWGRPQSDSAPDFFLPIGFAGGLADPVTGLVRFGLRDYDPETGRWTAPDPINFAGGQLNLYEYVGSDPVSTRDPSGLFAVCGGINAYAGVGAGFSICLGDEGVSACVEGGVGIGGDVGLGAGEHIESAGKGTLVAEFGAGFGPLGVGADCEVLPDDPKCNRAVTCRPKAKIGPIELTADGAAAKSEALAGVEFHGVEASAKLVAKKCFSTR